MKYIKNLSSIAFILFLAIIPAPVWAEIEPTFQMDEVVVTASKAPLFAKQNPWSTSIIDADLLNNFSLKTLPEALAFSPSIDLKRNGGLGSVSTLRIRGGTTQQTLILLDGQPINSPLLGTIDIGDFLIGSVNKAEIVRAPISSLYGADAAAGAINLMTTPGNIQSTSEVGVDFGSFNTQKYMFNAGGRYSDMGVRVSVVRLSSDGFRENSASDIQNYFAGFDFLRDDGKISFRALKILSYKQVPGVPQNDRLPYSASTPGDWQRDNDSYLKINWQKNIMPSSDINLGFFLNNMEENWHGYDFSGAAFVDSDYLASENGADLQYGHENRDNKFVGGVDFKNAYGSNTYVGDKNVQNLAIYGDEELGIKSPLIINMGVRADQHTIAGTAVSPRIGMIYNFSDDLAIKNTCSGGFRAPTINDLYWYDPAWKMYGSRNLEPERTFSVDSGLYYKTGYASEIHLTGFILDASDLISWDWDPSTNITRAKNINASSSQGLELEYNDHMNFNTFTFCNITLQNVTDVQDVNPSYIGKRIPYSPDIKYSAGFSWQNPYGLQVGVNLRGSGERFADAANSVKLKPYNVANLQVSVQGISSRIIFSIDNLTDEQYYESVGVQPITYQILGYPMPGRTYSLGYQANL